MVHIGCFLSASNGYLAMGETALCLGGDTFQFFTRNPRGGRARPMDTADAAALTDFLRAHDFAPILAHAPYTLNPCSDTPRTREFALETMADDLDRLSYLPGACYNFHPGSHVGQGTEAGIAMIADTLNRILTAETSTTVLLETMAGKGSEVGGKFEELAEILSRVQFSDKMGVCLDTCHVYDGGYDIVGDLDGVLESFDRIIGLPRLKAIHLNDSKYPFASHHDRHEKLGDGSLGLEAIGRILRHPQLKALPFHLETPNDLEGYAREIALVRQLAGASGE